MEQIDIKSEIARLDAEINDLTNRAWAGDPEAIAQIAAAEKRLDELWHARDLTDIWRQIGEKLAARHYIS